MVCGGGSEGRWCAAGAGRAAAGGVDQKVQAGMDLWRAGGREDARTGEVRASADQRSHGTSTYYITWAWQLLVTVAGFPSVAANANASNGRKPRER